MARSASSAPAAPGLRVRAGRVSVDATDTSAVDAAIAQSNAKLRIALLADVLNPSIIDPAKAHALLAALAKLPASALAPLRGHSLYLNAPELPIKTTSPTTPGSFVHLGGIAAADLQGDTALVRLRMRLDCDLARTQAAAARPALDAIKAVVAQYQAVREAATGEVETQALHDLSAARLRRFAIAGAWAENAAAAHACAPGDAHLRAEHEAAQQALSEFAVPSGGGLE